jgi:CDP-glucose 4,6-dehydratase
VEDAAVVSDTWRGRRVLVTGATGVVGAWLVKELLSRGAYVVAFVLDHDPQSELYRSGDIRHVNVVDGALEDFGAVARAITAHEIGAVFHLGAQAIVSVAHRAPLATLESNVRGTYNVLEACRAHRDLVERVVIASSDKAYGTQPVLPYTEDMPLVGRHPYEVSKTCADLIAQAYHHTYGVPIGIARCGNVYGGGDLNWTRIVPGTIRSLLRGDRPVIRSDGTCVRDYIYVKDAARAYIRLAECLHDPDVVGTAFNFSSESPITVMDIVTAILRQMGREGITPEIRNAAVGEIHSQYLSAARAHRVLNWYAEFDLEHGLKETVAWYQHHFQDYAGAW